MKKKVRRNLPSEEATYAVRDSGHDVQEQLPIVSHDAQVIPLLELGRYQHLVRPPAAMKERAGGKGQVGKVRMV
jgi:hypothetical protein